MRCIIICLAACAAMASSSLYGQTDFRSTGSGVWTDSRNWQEKESGVWLEPQTGNYPGERHNRNADVSVGDGSIITIGKDEVVQVNSLTIFDGRVVVEGSLIIGPTKDDPVEVTTDTAISQIDPNSNPLILTDTITPLLLQNVPNPLAPQFGFETTIRFYLDKQYSASKLNIYDQLGHLILEVDQQQNPAPGWHTVHVRLDRLQSGSYPLLLELPGNVLRRMITVLR